MHCIYKRADRYLPDDQAAIIHTLVTDLLKSEYETDNVNRFDKPELSVYIGDEDDEKHFFAEDTKIK